jgi:hypothetical protein
LKSGTAERLVSPSTVISSQSPPAWNEFEVLGLESRSDDWWQELAVNNESLMFATSPSEMTSLGDYQDPMPSPDIKHLEQLFTSNIPVNYRVCESIMATFPSPSLSGFHIALPNSLTLNSAEHEALRHYQTTYSLYRTTKDPNWSTHKVLLRLGSQELMIMHLVLAVSINDYSLRCRQSSSSQEAEVHFQAGAQLLIGAMKTDLESDNVIILAAFFFVYLYMSKRQSTTTQQLNQLSLTVSDYVQRQDLVACCINPLPLQGQSPVRSTLSSHDRSLLARLIMWTLDEDVKCSFQGTGGHLARYLATLNEKTKDIYLASRNALGDHWGTNYPHSQILDDDQNSTVLEFLWAMMPLWQDINDLSGESHSDLSESCSRIEQKFSLLKEVC